jgi:F-type H+-transporting ATPase subunit a
MVELLLTYFLRLSMAAEHVASGEGGEHAFNINEYSMHHVKDVVLYPLHAFGFDISITKHVLMVWITVAILGIFLPLIVRSRRLAPKGPANALEALVVFLRDELLIPNLGKEGEGYYSYLLTAFFFVMVCNLLGLVPMAATATGNISVTASLACITFILVQFSCIRAHGFVGYIKSFVPSGLPPAIVPFIFLVELVGMFTKHCTLAIRLFANMIAGHLVIFTLLALIFMFKNYIVAPFSIAGVLFISMLEMLVALIQAYIFTILSAIFIGMSVKSHH